MKLNLKMMLLFSAMMVAAVAILSSYSTQLNIDSFSDLSTVSYTHLDVYKRQILVLGTTIFR